MEILYSDDRLIVCIKPVGLDSEHDMPQKLQEQLGGEIYTLHRLDQNVGGVMVYARNKQTAAHFSKMIQEGLLVKEYVALVHGVPPENDDWEDLLFKDSRKNKVFVVDRQRTGVKKARLTFQRLTAGERSLVRIRLYTGRSHQIRVQFASRGYPLVGDRKYGARDEVKAPMLYSCCLRFSYNKQDCCFEKLPNWDELQWSKPTGRSASAVGIWPRIALRSWLYATCIAMTDKIDKTVLIWSTDHDCYEVDNRKIGRGPAEKAVSHFLEKLNDMKSE